MRKWYLSTFAVTLGLLSNPAEALYFGATDSPIYFDYTINNGYVDWETVTDVLETTGQNIYFFQVYRDSDIAELEVLLTAFDPTDISVIAVVPSALDVNCNNFATSTATWKTGTGSSCLVEWETIAADLADMSLTYDNLDGFSIAELREQMCSYDVTSTINRPTHKSLSGYSYDCISQARIEDINDAANAVSSSFLFLAYNLAADQVAQFAQTSISLGFLSSAFGTPTVSGNSVSAYHNTSISMGAYASEEACESAATRTITFDVIDSSDSLDAALQVVVEPIGGGTATTTEVYGTIDTGINFVNLVTLDLSTAGLCANYGSAKDYDISLRLVRQYTNNAVMKVHVFNLSADIGGTILDQADFDDYAYNIATSASTSTLILGTNDAYAIDHALDGYLVRFYTADSTDTSRDYFEDQYNVVVDSDPMTLSEVTNTMTTFEGADPSKITLALIPGIVKAPSSSGWSVWDPGVFSTLLNELVYDAADAGDGVVIWRSPLTLGAPGQGMLSHKNNHSVTNQNFEAYINSVIFPIEGMFHMLYNVGTPEDITRIYIADNEGYSSSVTNVSDKQVYVDSGGGGSLLLYTSESWDEGTEGGGCATGFVNRTTLGISGLSAVGGSVCWKEVFSAPPGGSTPAIPAGSTVVFGWRLRKDMGARDQVFFIPVCWDGTTEKPCELNPTVIPADPTREPWVFVSGISNEYYSTYGTQYENYAEGMWDAIVDLSLP